MIRINNLKYKNIFNNINLEINMGDFAIILGSNLSGKSTLSRILSGQIKSKEIIINTENVSLINENILVDGIVKENLNKELIKKFNLTKIEDFEIKYLSQGQKELVNILFEIEKKPDIIVFDNCLMNIDYYTKDKLIKFIKKNNITTIYITSESEDTLYGNKLGFIIDKKVELYETMTALDEKNFKRINQKLPFMVDLSNKLKYYKLINKIYLNESKMVDKIWK